MMNAKAIPDDNTLGKAAQLDIFDLKGKPVKFGSIYDDQKTIVVFIRHFMCGACQLYVENLTAVPSASLERSGVKIVVIGCGEWNCIETYAEITKFTGSIYADPSRSLYRSLGMNLENLERTPEGQARKSYLTMSFFNITLRSIWRSIKNPILIREFEVGKISQLGGEFIFGPANTCSFASRMQHTQDHIEVLDLVKQAGVDID